MHGRHSDGQQQEHASKAFAFPSYYHETYEGGSVETEEEEAKAAEFQSIYGDSASVQPTSAFAPPTAPPSVSAGSQAAAAAAMALLNDEEPRPQAQPQPVSQTPMHDFIDEAMTAEAPKTVVKSGGVQLPPSMQQSASPVEEKEPELNLPEPSASTSHACTACSAPFSVTLPDGIEQAVVACPSCNTDNVITA